MIAKTVVRNSSLGHRVKALSDWVKTSAGSKWNMGSIAVSSEGIRISITKIGSISISLRLGISRSLSIVVSMIAKTVVRNSSLCHRVKSLGDWVKTSAGSKWNMGSIGMSIWVTISKIGGISISLRLGISRSLSIVVSMITQTIVRN